MKFNSISILFSIIFGVPYIILILITSPALINARCLFSENNVILTSSSSCLLHWMMQISDMGFISIGKNLLLEERILSFKS